MQCGQSDEICSAINDMSNDMQKFVSMRNK